MWKWEADDAKGVMVMVHGASEHHRRYKWLIEKWISEGFHVIMGDLPGQGLSIRNRGHIDTFDEYIQEIMRWIEEAKRYELPIFLLGHSMGGLAVIRTLQENHVSIEAVILSSPCVDLIKYPPTHLEALSVVLNRFAPAIKVRSHIDTGIATRNQEIIELDKNDSLFVRKVSVRWYRELVKAMKLAHKLVDKFPNVPLLVMQAGQDKIINTDSVKEWFNGLENDEKMYKEWNGLYHEIFNEPEREEVFHYVKHFALIHCKDNYTRS